MAYDKNGGAMSIKTGKESTSTKDREDHVSGGPHGTSSGGDSKTTGPNPGR